MTDTVRTIPELQTLLRDGQLPGSITEQTIRDMLVSLFPVGGVMPDAQLATAIMVDKGDVSGLVDRTWLATERAQRQRLTGDTVTTLLAIPIGQYLFLDVEQDEFGEHAHTILVGGGLPVLRWDGGGAPPEQSQGANRKDSYIAYNDTGTRTVIGRTWTNIPTV